MGALVLEHEVSQWMEGTSGRSELLEHLRMAKAQDATIRLVIAHPAPDQARLVGQVADERRIRKDYSVRDDLIGTLELFDGDVVRVIFRRAG